VASNIVAVHKMAALTITSAWWTTRANAIVERWIGTLRRNASTTSSLPGPATSP
jgi:hypothetical protein